MIDRSLIDDATPAQHRKSTLLVAVIFGAISGWQWYRGRPLAMNITAALAAILFVVALIPPAAKRFFAAWMALAGVLGYFSTRILLSVFFYVIMTPVGAIMRLTGHQGMGSHRRQKLPTYWQPREHTRQSREGFERAF